MTDRSPITSRMIQLAADILCAREMPNVDNWPWPSRASQKLCRRARKDEEAAREQCRLWAIQLRNLADELAKEQPHD